MRKIIACIGLAVLISGCGDQGDRTAPVPVESAPRDLPKIHVTEWQSDGSYGYRIGRFHDDENGATCWIVAGKFSNPEALSCIPDTQLKEK